MYWKIGASEGVMEILKEYCNGNMEYMRAYLKQLGDVIGNIPKGKFKVDTSDNFVSFNDIPLSFIRDWKNHTITILSPSDTFEIDNHIEKNGKA